MRALKTLLGSAATILTVLLPGGTVLAFDLTDTPPIPSASRPRFHVGSASRIGAVGPEVMLALRVPYSELTFSSVSDETEEVEARFDLTMVLNTGKRQVGGDLWHERVVASLSESRSRDSYFEKVVLLPAADGRLRARVSLQERHSGRGSAAEWELEVPDYREEMLSISSLWPGDCRADFANRPSFPPEGWRLDPRFGPNPNDLCILGEVYRQEDSEPVEAVWRLLDVRRDVLESHEMTLTGGRQIPFSIQPDLGNLWLGSYLFELEVKSGGHKARRRFEFQMDETLISPEGHLEESLELLRIIAKKEDIERIQDLPEGERAFGWGQYWEDHDPTPGTLDNEFRDQFFTRVRHVNEHFGVLEPGWKSDRGRVYIKYGPPDEIETRPSTPDGLAFEIWIYLAQRKRFVFVDYDGFGRFELYQPGRS